LTKSGYDLRSRRYPRQNFTRERQRGREYGVTGNRGFFTDASGVIRFAAGADADVTGTPIGQ
jgi:hypothetical protein